MLPRSKSRNQSRSLVASAVLLACLALAAQSHARAILTAAATPGTRHHQAFPRDLTALVARAQRLLTTGPAPVSRSLFKATLHPATALAATPAETAGLRASTSQTLFQASPAPATNARWMRTSRAWAS
jgi:hypothetical protein